MDLKHFATQFCMNNVGITKRKNADYTGSDVDIFKNFRAVWQYGVKPEDGFITRMVDKIARIETALSGKKLQVMDESLKDTLADLANYSMLFAGYLLGTTKLVQHAENYYAGVLDRMVPQFEQDNNIMLEEIKGYLEVTANLSRTKGNLKQSVQSLNQIAYNCILIAYNLNG